MYSAIFIQVSFVNLVLIVTVDLLDTDKVNQFVNQISETFKSSSEKFHEQLNELKEKFSKGVEVDNVQQLNEAIGKCKLKFDEQFKKFDESTKDNFKQLSNDVIKQPAGITGSNVNVKVDVKGLTGLLSQGLGMVQAAAPSVISLANKAAETGLNIGSQAAQMGLTVAGQAAQVGLQTGAKAAEVGMQFAQGGAGPAAAAAKTGGQAAGDGVAQVAKEAADTAGRK
ncbi:hypothetical protein HDE_09860 [Halotydeus destructor]|nr:hypothetical protein HDE_09860 [Halotydeus destructor]